MEPKKSSKFVNVTKKKNQIHRYRELVVIIRERERGGVIQGYKGLPS